ncbi:hypothetical protein CYMTET_4400 [Cymbomonas tetramitiformis]|uniref:UvrD-like helicase C-terminal domain-containing protein n=1 Tax=Cymbomonas tetramitiformis TaxID=36881 RepID=A0AAE0LKE9_9CHLO|nr:hypothetical protein CYMTET_4400 [Cymbomonas tetramitiformis]
MHYSARFHRSNTDQREVAQDVLLRGRNVLMLGGAGTGKSDTIQLVRDLWTARESSDRVRALGPVVVASPIGCAAARHEDGCTLDALFAVGALQNHDACVSRYAARLRQVDSRGKKRARRVYDECPVARVRQMGLLVVEEVTGLCCKKLRLIDALLRMARGCQRPSGGVTLLFVGDFLQLDASGADVGNRLYSSPLLRVAGFVVHVLRANVRQAGDLVYANLLERVREGRCTEADRTTLLSKTVSHSDDVPDEVWYLCSTNEMADKRNSECYERKVANHADGITYTPTFRWRDSSDKEGDYVDAPAKLGPIALSDIPETIATAYRELYQRHGHAMNTVRLCPEARVMLCQNRNREMGDNRMMNDRRGVIKGVTAEEARIVFDDADGKITKIPIRVARPENAAADCELRYMPLRLSWACTIHKAQGGEADQVFVDCDRLFDARLFYVALTRCRSLDGLSLRRFTHIPDMSQLPEAKLYANLKKKTKTMGRAYDCITDGDLQELITYEVH